MFVKQCEQCCEKRKRKETASGVVVKPILVKDFNDLSTQGKVLGHGHILRRQCCKVKIEGIKLLKRGNLGKLFTI